jgi:acyl transferase domain-containing protein
MPSREPIAVIGMACRFPGGCDTPDAYWRLLRDGGDGVVEVPGDRWDIDAFYDPDPKAVGKIYARRGGFLTEPVDRFDAAFFGMSPHEAWALDPAQRLLLEVAWECLEHAAIPPHSVTGTDTGVFVGMSGSDYIHEQMRLGGDNDLSAYHATGVHASFGSGHVSHFLGAEGPSVSVDTACSSSLVATLLALDALLAGRCRVALAGGSRLILSPASSIVLCRLGALSPSGVSRVFDGQADGYVRGEGAGMIALKRLSHAVEDGDRVLALIRGGAWNHDGKSSSLTIPRQEAQEAVMRAGIRDAGLEPPDVSYVEAHGTGTPVGDPVEAMAIGNVYGTARDGRGPIVVGSCKTNIGHLEIAAGMAGLIKTVLALGHRQIPAHLHFEQPNPQVEWHRYAIRIPRRTEPWEPHDGSRIAAVSSFGLSGTNAHLLLGEAPPTEAPAARPTRAVRALAASGRTQGAVRDLVARRLLPHLDRGEEPPPPPDRGGGSRSGGDRRGPRSAHGGPHLARCRLPHAADRVPLHRAGRPVPGNGAGAVRDLSGLSRGARAL